jgi:hypothetical protein
MNENTSLCVHLLANTKQPLAGFINDDGIPMYYCAECLYERIENVLQNEQMHSQEILETLTFANCGHEDDEEACRKCWIAISAALTIKSIERRFKNKGGYQIGVTRRSAHRLL